MTYYSTHTIVLYLYKYETILQLTKYEYTILTNSSNNFLTNNGIPILT